METEEPVGFRIVRDSIGVFAGVKYFGFCILTFAGFVLASIVSLIWFWLNRVKWTTLILTRRMSKMKRRHVQKCQKPTMIIKHLFIQKYYNLIFFKNTLFWNINVHRRLNDFRFILTIEHILKFLFATELDINNFVICICFIMKILPFYLRLFQL